MISTQQIIFITLTFLFILMIDKPEVFVFYATND